MTLKIRKLLEFLRRAFWCILAFLIGTAIFFPFSENLLSLILQPFADVFYEKGREPNLILTSPQETFFLFLRVSMLGGIIFALPIIIYLIWKFAASEPHQSERGTPLKILIAAPIVFICGALLGYFLITTLTISLISKGYTLLGSFVPRNNISNTLLMDISFGYSIKFIYQLVLKYMFVVGLWLQIPIVFILLSRAGTLRSVDLKSLRIYAIIASIIITIYWSLSDSLYSFLLFNNLYLLIFFALLYGIYEVSIQLTKHFETRI